MMASEPRDTKSSSIDRARAAPSAGSVPVPISSMSTNDNSSARATISRRFTRWAEKVERLWAIDCSSPMSAKKEWKTGSRVPCPTGGIIPDCANADISPMPFKRTLLPPVLGPETTSARSSGAIFRSNGTTGLSPDSSTSGCRPSRISNPLSPSCDSSGATPPHERAILARAYRVSNSVSASKAPQILSDSLANNAVSTPRIRRTSLASSPSRSRTRFISSMASGGST